MVLNVHETSHLIPSASFTINDNIKCAVPPWRSLKRGKKTYPEVEILTCKSGSRVGAEREARGGEMLLMLAGGWRASALRSEEAGRFREVAGMSIVAAGGPRSR